MGSDDIFVRSHMLNAESTEEWNNLLTFRDSGDHQPYQ